MSAATPATPPIVQIAQALVDDVTRRGEVAALIYGTEKVRLAEYAVQAHAERAKLIEALRGALGLADLLHHSGQLSRDPRLQHRYMDAAALLRELGEAS